MHRIGIIGAGNMGGAIVRGLLDAGYLKAGQIAVSDINPERLADLAETYGPIGCYQDARDLCLDSEMILLAVKPHFLAGVIEHCADELAEKAVISIAAGWTFSMLTEKLDPLKARCLRVMPNTPAMVGEGMTVICEQTSFLPEELEFAKGIFDSLGRSMILPERMFDGVIAISGSSPAYVYMMIEAMADGGVREGIPRAAAIELAAQSVMGSALMVLSGDTHPAALKDAVCSPGGTTIEAVAELEKRGFRAAVLDAMAACADKSRKMAK